MGSEQNDAARRTKINSVVTQYAVSSSIDRSVSRDTFIQQHPDLMPELGEALTNQRLVALARQNFAKNSDASVGATEDTEMASQDTATLVVRCPHCSDSVEIQADIPWSDITCICCGNVFSLVTDQHATHEAPTLKRIAHFELIERIGVGGFGTVWKARDTILDRTVALKLPRQGQLTEEDIDKFLREARAAAQLRHPNIVSVHEVGRSDDAVYIVSDLVRGVSMADWMAIRPPSVRESAEQCLRISKALEHAHRAGIVHRDLKPGNIMIDADDQPHIMDFGLAKRDAGEVTMTLEGQLLGTPAYMAPEQAMGQAHLSSPRSDIYSLGVIMFELITGELPFRGNTSMLIHQVINVEPPSPRSLNNHVPVDLETICLRCLEKDASARFETARDLADELHRFIQQQPILSRPIGPITRVGRWCRRHQAIAGLIAAVIILLIVGSSVSTYFSLRAAGFQGQAEDYRREAALKETEIQHTRQTSGALAVKAGSFFEAGTAFMRSPYNRQLQSLAPLVNSQPGAALALLEDEQRCPSSMRDFAWRMFHGMASRPFQVEQLVGQGWRAMGFSRDAQSLLMVSKRGQVQLARPDTHGRWRVTQQYDLPESDRDSLDALRRAETVADAVGSSPAIAVLPDELAVIARSDDGLWRSSSESPDWTRWLAELVPPSTRVSGMSLSPDRRTLALLVEGRRDASASTGQAIEIVDLEDSRSIGTLQRPRADVLDLAFVGNEPSDLVLCQTDRKWIGVQGERSQSCARVLNRAKGRVVSSAGPLAVLEDAVILSDPSAASRTKRLPVPCGRLDQGAFSPDGKWLVAASGDGGLCFWQLRSGPIRWSVEDADVLCLEFSPDAEYLAVANHAGIRLFESVSGDEKPPIAADGVIARMAWSPDGRRLAYCQEDGRARVVDFAGRRQQIDVDSDEAFLCLDFRTNDELLLGDEAGHLTRWSIPSRSSKEITAYDAPVLDVAYCTSRYVTLVASGARIFAHPSSRDPFVLEGHTSRVESVSISRNGDSLLSCSEDGEVRRWRVNWVKGTANVAPLLLPSSGRDTVEISPSGETFATLDRHRVVFWDAKSGAFRGAVSADRSLKQARFCTRPLEGASRLAVGDEQGALQVWTGDDVIRQPTTFLGGVVRSIIRCGDGSQFACVGDFPHVALIDSNRLQSQHVILGDATALHVAASESAVPLLAIGRWDGSIDLCRLSLATSEIEPMQTLDIGLALMHLQLSADGRLLLAVAGNQVRCWRRDESGQFQAADAPLGDDSSGVTCALLSDDGLVCLSAAENGHLEQWLFDASTLKWQLSKTGVLHEGVIRSLGWMPDGKVASIADDGRLVVWDMASNKVIAAVDEPDARGLATSRVSPAIAVGSGAAVNVWKLEGDKLRRHAQPLAEHEANVVQLVFSADGKRLVSVSEDRSVKSWSMVTRKKKPSNSVVPDDVRQMFETGKRPGPS